MNDDLIPRSVAKDEILSWAVCLDKPHLLRKDDTLHVLDTIPSVEAEPVVHCGECIYRNTVSCVLDGLHFGTTEDNDFCSRGKRRAEHGK